ncbi:MAG: L,D-transpeptidase family protein, partial [Nanoarchaeota archaeon]|nr:L,D-transpeptidase family protein [Nanoarchaeota archaeon]
LSQESQKLSKEQFAILRAQLFDAQKSQYTLGKLDTKKEEYKKEITTKKEELVKLLNEGETEQFTDEQGNTQSVPYNYRQISEYSLDPDSRTKAKISVGEIFVSVAATIPPPVKEIPIIQETQQPVGGGVNQETKTQQGICIKQTTNENVYSKKKVINTRKLIDFDFDKESTLQGYPNFKITLSKTAYSDNDYILRTNCGTIEFKKSELNQAKEIDCSSTNQIFIFKLAAINNNIPLYNITIQEYVVTGLPDGSPCSQSEECTNGYCDLSDEVIGGICLQKSQQIISCNSNKDCPTDYKCSVTISQATNEKTITLTSGETYNFKDQGFSIKLNEIDIKNKGVLISPSCENILTNYGIMQGKTESFCDDLIKITLKALTGNSATLLISFTSKTIKTCSDCGGSFFDTNTCDKQECNNLGNCYFLGSFQDNFFKSCLDCPSDCSNLINIYCNQCSNCQFDDSTKKCIQKKQSIDLLDDKDYSEDTTAKVITPKILFKNINIPIQGYFVLVVTGVPGCTQQKLGCSYNSKTVTKDCQALYLFKDQKLVEGYPKPVSTGAKPGAKEKEGDLKTPVGDYILDKRSGVSGIEPKIQLYINYPIQKDIENAKNKGIKSLGGLIEIHGPVNSAKIGKRASAGCVRMCTNDIKKLYTTIIKDVETKGVPIKIVEEINFEGRQEPFV